MDTSPFFSHVIDQRLGTTYSPNFDYITSGDGSDPASATTSDLIASRRNAGDTHTSGIILRVANDSSATNIATVTTVLHLTGQSDKTIQTVGGTYASPLITTDVASLFNQLSTHTLGIKSHDSLIIWDTSGEVGTNYIAFDATADGGEVETKGFIVAPTTNSLAESKISLLGANTTSMTGTYPSHHPAYGAEIVYTDVARTYGGTSYVRDGLVLSTVTSGGTHTPQVNLRTAGGIDLLQDLYFVEASTGTTYDNTKNIDFVKYDASTSYSGLQLTASSMGSDDGGNFKILPGFTMRMGETSTTTLRFARSSNAYALINNLSGVTTRYKSHGIPARGFLIGYDKVNSVAPVMGIGGTVDTDGTPSVPVVRDSITVAGADPISIAGVSGSQYVYIARQTAGLTVIDASDQTNLVEGTTIDAGTYDFTDMEAMGNYLYISADANGLLTYNLTDPANPAYVTQYLSGTSYNSVTIDTERNYLYVGRANIVTVLSISNPASPSFVADITLTGVVGKVSYDDYWLFVPCATAGFYVIDATTPATPTTYGPFATTGNAYHIALARIGGGRYGFVSTASQIESYDLNTPATPGTALDTLVLAGSMFGGIFKESAQYYMWVGRGASGLSIVTVTDPNTMSPLSTDATKNVVQFYHRDDTVYTTGGADIIYAYDISLDLKVDSMNVTFYPDVIIQRDITMSGPGAWSSAAITAGTNVTLVANESARRTKINKTVQLMISADITGDATAASSGEMTIVIDTGFGIPSTAVVSHSIGWSDDTTTYSPVRLEIANNQAGPTINVLIRGVFVASTAYTITGTMFYETG